LYREDGTIERERWFEDGVEYTPGEDL